MTDTRYPCATEPSCGMNHEMPGKWPESGVANRAASLINIQDHANHYIELVRKLRDQRTVTGMIVTKLGSLHGPTATRIYDALLEYLGLTKQEPCHHPRITKACPSCRKTGQETP